VSVDTLNPIYSSVDGVLFDKNQTTLIEYPYGKAGSYTIPSSVTIIGDWAFFQCGRLITVTIPSSVVSIGDDAFSSCYSLTSLAIPHSVTHLGASAFEDCLSLTSVTLPNSVTNIADGMFENCRSLTSVTIPNGVTSIGKQAFASCGLGSVTIPSSVFSLGPWAFAGCWKLRSVYCEGNAPSLGNQYVFGNDSSATVYYSPGTFGWGATYGGLPTALGPPPPPYIFATNNSAITITGYFGEGGAVTIPTRINGLLVTSIGDWAFENCSSVTSVTILNGVTNIGAWAFHNCTRLTGITIPSSVASIANWAFCSCTNLTSITIPNGVTSLGNWAFIDCTSLTNVMIGSGVTSIGDWAFSGCASLTSICFAGNAPSLGGSSVFSGDNDATVYYLPGTTGWGLTFGGLPTALWQSPPPMAWTLSASTITASGAMLNGTVNPSGSFTAARFEWGTTTGYGNLTSLANLGSGTNALPLSAPLAGLTPGVTYHFRVAATNVYGLAYGSDQSFTTLGPPQVSRLPATAVTTNSAALNGTVNPNGYPTTAWFQWGTTTGYGNLTAATDMGSGISNLPLSVALTGLTPGVTYHFRITVTNDYGLAYASDQSFTTATLPTEFNYWINNGAVTITRYNGPGGDVIIPYAINGLPVTGIGDYAFAGCNSLTSVTIPNSVTSIGHDAFGACTSLTSISVGTLNSAYSSVEGVLFNKTQTTLVQYPAGIAATSYSIPNSVTSMGDYAFDSCTSLTSITIPNSVTSIGNYVCGGCTSLSSVTIPAGVTIIGEWAFSGCSSLTNLTIPNSVTSIGQEAFDWCTNLTSITIPNSVTSIGDYAFYGCTSLRSVTIGSGVTSIGTNAFFYCFSLTAITVDAANSFYSSVDGVWLNKSQTTLIECPGGKTGAYTIPNGVTGIGRFAFAYCTSLLSVTIPSSVTNIGSEAFWSCINLTSVTIPDSVSSIADYAFQWCTNLTSVTIGSGVTDIGFAAFYNCTSLTSVTIGSGVTDIGSAAFYACTNLTRLYFGGNAPSLGGSVFPGDNHATVYYLPGTTGWGSTFGGRPTALWTQVPTIQASPQSQTAEAASAVGLRVKASSPLPLFYFWHLNATNLLSSGTNWQLELTNLELSQSGAYTVVISNVLGAITSAPALLNVIAPVERRPVPGIKVTGETGSLLNLDYTDSLSPAPRWTPLGSVSLASASQSYFDLTLPLPLQRFYRAWQTGTPGVLPYLNLQLVPAITLTGSIGHSVRVDAINQFGPVDAWFTLDTVTLTNTSQLYFDTSAWQQPPRLYRLMQVP